MYDYITSNNIINILESASSTFFFNHFHEISLFFSLSLWFTQSVAFSHLLSHQFICLFSRTSPRHSKSLEFSFMPWAQLEHSILTLIRFCFSTFGLNSTIPITHRKTHIYTHTHTSHVHWRLCLQMFEYYLWRFFLCYSRHRFLCLSHSDAPCKLVIQHENLSRKFAPALFIHRKAFVCFME